MTELLCCTQHLGKNKIFVHFAFRHKSFDAVKFPVDKACININRKDRYGRSALDHEIKSKNIEIVNVIY